MPIHVPLRVITSNSGFGLLQVEPCQGKCQVTGQTACQDSCQDSCQESSQEPCQARTNINKRRHVYQPLVITTTSSVHHFSQLCRKIRKGPPLQKTNVRLSTYNGTHVPIRGTCHMVVHNKNQDYDLEFIIANVKTEPILGSQASVVLGLLKRIYVQCE